MRQSSSGRGGGVCGGGRGERKRELATLSLWVGAGPLCNLSAVCAVL